MSGYRLHLRHQGLHALVPLNFHVATAISRDEMERSRANPCFWHHVGVVIGQQSEAWKTFGGMRWAEASVIEFVGVSARF